MGAVAQICYASLHPALHSIAKRSLARLGARPDADTVGGRVLLAVLATVAARAGERPEQVRADAQRALSGGSTRQQSIVLLLSAAHNLLHLDQFEQVLELTGSWLEAARRSGSMFDFAAASYLRYAAHLRRGELVQAEASARSVVETAASHGLEDGFFHVRPLVAELLCLRGFRTEAADVLRSSVVAGDLSASYQATMFVEARGRARLVLGPTDQALGDLLEAGERLLAIDIRNPSYSAWRSLSALAIVQLGRPDEASRLAGLTGLGARLGSRPSPATPALPAVGGDWEIRDATTPTAAPYPCPTRRPSGVHSTPPRGAP